VLPPATIEAPAPPPPFPHPWPSKGMWVFPFFFPSPSCRTQAAPPIFLSPSTNPLIQLYHGFTAIPFFLFTRIYSPFLPPLSCYKTGDRIGDTLLSTVACGPIIGVSPFSPLPPSLAGGTEEPDEPFFSSSPKTSLGTQSSSFSLTSPSQHALARLNVPFNFLQAADVPASWGTVRGSPFNAGCT